MKRHGLLVAIFASMALAGWAGDSEIIVESYADGLNSQAFSKVEGKWNESSGKSTAPGLKATKSVYNDANADPGTVRFTPNIPIAGKYEVFITYPVQGNASDVKFTVVSADGSKEIAVTENGRQAGHTPAANEWSSIGTFNFAQGNSGYIEIKDPLTGAHPLVNEPNARIYADAIKLVPQGFSLPADYTNAGGGTSAAAPAPAATTTVATTVTTTATAVAPAGTVAGLPSLPGASAPAAGATAALPALPGAATPAMPSLPGSTADAATAMPALPGATGTLPSLPATPAAGAAAALPGLPATPAAGTAALPALPATPALAPGLPSLPTETVSATTTVESATVVAAATTPIPTPNLPSLAPVTPTPQRNLPSPSDTPVAGVPSGLPNGRLNNLPPMPGPGVPELPTGPAAPIEAPPIPGMPTPAVAAATPYTATAAPTPTPNPLDQSITQYNPSGLQWMYDFGAALKSAASQNKKVMVFFTAPGNQVASTYETEYFRHPALRQALSNYVLVKVDFPKNTRLGYSLGIFGAGVIVVTDSSGNVTSRIEQLPPTPVDLIRLMASATPQAAATPAAGATAEVTVTTTTVTTSTM